jgi:hypothetical protein
VLHEWSTSNKLREVRSRYFFRLQRQPRRTSRPPPTIRMNEGEQILNEKAFECAKGLRRETLKCALLYWVNGFRMLFEA